MNSWVEVDDQGNRKLLVAETYSEAVEEVLSDLGYHVEAIDEDDDVPF